MGGNLLVAHGGGPTAVINASLYGVIKEAEAASQISKVLGAFHGIEGVLNEQFIDLSIQEPSQIDLLPFTPSSALGSCRRKLNSEDYPLLIEIFKKHQIKYFLYNGGNDSMDTCEKVGSLAKQEGLDLQVIGIPKTIDNDLAFTDHCPGFGSAARYVAMSTRDLWMEVQAMPLYATFLETMGRNAGWLAAAAALAQYDNKPCAQLIYLPEIPYNEDLFLSQIEEKLSQNNALLVVVSEGLVDQRGESIANMGMVDGFGHKIPGGVAQALSETVRKKLGAKARAEKPGFLGRSSFLMQSATDRKEAVEVGRQAVRAVLAGKSGLMISIIRDSDSPYHVRYGEVELKEVANVEHKFPIEWINAEGNHVTKSFNDYCQPLIGEAFPEYAKLKSNY